jgi:hypothetical protein
MPSSTLSSQGQRTPLNVRWHAPGPRRDVDCYLDINSELDELDREEFYRLKKVSNKKQRDQAAADAEMRRKMEEQKGKPEQEKSTGPEAQDVLGEHEDDDVIF